MNTTQQPKPVAPAGKAQQLKTAAKAVPKTGKVSKSTQKCPPKPKSDWSCVKYHALRGPKYTNKQNRQAMSSYRNWHALIDSGKITEADAKLMLIMSPNEGDFNSVQAFDNQAITAGAMQKTADSSGQGELPDQISDFKKANPANYKSLFEEKGWTVDEVEIIKKKKNKQGKVIETKEKKNVMSYSYTDKDGKLVTVGGDKLYGFIKDYCSATAKENAGKALDSMRQAMEDDDFKERQVLDFKKRIDQAIGQKPKGYDYPISDYMSSAKGRALALDQSVNRPAYVDDDYGKALDQFYENNPKVSKNPADWGDKRSDYENQINELYGPNRQGTDMKNRYEAIDKAPMPTIPDDVHPAQSSVPPLLRPALPTTPSTDPFSWFKF